MIRLNIIIFDLLHLAANTIFFVIGFSIKLNPVTAFVYMPLILFSIWSIFFGLRSFLWSKYRSQAIKPKATDTASNKPLRVVLES